MAFRDGDKVSDLESVGEVGRRNTGTVLPLLAGPGVLRQPLVLGAAGCATCCGRRRWLCPGLTVTFLREEGGERERVVLRRGPREYLGSALDGAEVLPARPFAGSLEGNTEAADWAVSWTMPGGDGAGARPVSESYVN